MGSFEFRRVCSSTTSKKRIWR